MMIIWSLIQCSTMILAIFMMIIAQQKIEGGGFVDKENMPSDPVREAFMIAGNMTNQTYFDWSLPPFTSIIIAKGG